MPRILTEAGQVTIEKCIITTAMGVSANVALQVQAINVYESIFDAFTHGEIVIEESFDLKNMFPLIGEETVDLHMSTPSIEGVWDIKGIFYISDMTDVTPIGDTNTLYKFSFMSMNAITDINKKISKTFGGLVSEIANDIISNERYLNSDKIAYVETTTSSTKYTSNFWSPLKNLQYLAATAQNAGGAANYIVYEDRFNLNFVSMDALYDQDVTQTFIKTNFIRGASRNVMFDYQKIESYRIPRWFNYTERSVGGMYANRLITVDPITKKYSDTKLTLAEDFPLRKHLNQYSVSTVNSYARSDQRISYMPKHTTNFDNFADVTNAGTAQRRAIQMQSSLANRVEITVLGRMDYTVGQKVELQIPANAALNIGDGGKLDEVTSGYYIISSINHQINQKNHKCTMELIKDSYVMNINEGK